MREALGMFRAPRIFKKVYAWYLRYIKRDALYADLIDAWSEKTVPEYLALVVERDTYRQRWQEYWNEQQLDFILTVPNSLPAIPHGGMKDEWKACGYTFLFNLVGGSSTCSRKRASRSGYDYSSITPQEYFR